MKRLGRSWRNHDAAQLKQPEQVGVEEDEADSGRKEEGLEGSWIATDVDGAGSDYLRTCQIRGKISEDKSGRTDYGGLVGPWMRPWCANRLDIIVCLLTKEAILAILVIVAHRRI